MDRRSIIELKVYSESNFVPHMVVVKAGNQNERAKPEIGGNETASIGHELLQHRVHLQSAMNPLELERFNQLNNIIGIDRNCTNSCSSFMPIRQWLLIL